MSHLGWRWTQWITLILALSLNLTYFLLVPETYSPVLLSRRAQKQKQLLAGETYDNGPMRSDDNPADKKRIGTNVHTLARMYVLKPWIMLAQEPILGLVTLHMGFIYGFFYLSFVAYPITFEHQRGWNLGVGALPFLGTTVGVLVGVVIIIWNTRTHMRRKLARHGANEPEDRLPLMILGSILLPVGMFWFAWTSNPDIIWVPQVISGTFIGCGILLVFMQVCDRHSRVYFP